MWSSFGLLLLLFNCLFYYINILTFSKIKIKQLKNRPHCYLNEEEPEYVPWERPLQRYNEKDQPYFGFEKNFCLKKNKEKFYSYFFGLTLDWNNFRVWSADK